MATTVTVDCPICLIPFDENERRPLRTFCRCKQSLCEPCLNQLLQHGNQCPWDRTRWIGRNLIQKFVFSTPPNYLQYLQQKAVLDAQDSRVSHASKASSPPTVKKGTSDLVAEENVDQQLALLLMLQEETEQSKQRRQMEEDFLFAKQLLAEEVHRRISVNKDANSSSSVCKSAKGSKGSQSIGPSSLTTSQHDEKMVKLDKFLVPKPVEELWIADDDDDDVVEVIETPKVTPASNSPRKGKSNTPRLILSQTETSSQTTKKEKAAAPIMRFLQKIDRSALSEPSTFKSDYADPNPILAGIKRMRSLPVKAPVSSLEKKLIDITADHATARSSVSSSSSPSPPWSYRSSSLSSSSSSSRHVSSSCRRDDVDFDLTQHADSDGLDTDVQPRKRPAKSVARNRLLDEDDSGDSWDGDNRSSYSRDFSSARSKRKVTLRRTFLDHDDDDDDDDDDALLWTQSTSKSALYHS